MRCLICGTADGACGAAPLKKPVLGEQPRFHVDARGDVVADSPATFRAERPAADAAPVADVQVDDEGGT